MPISAITSIDHSVCKSLTGTFAYIWVMCQCCKAWTSVLPFMKVMLTQSSSTLKNTSLLHWLVSLSYFCIESPWRTRRMKTWKSYGVICHSNFLNQWDTSSCISQVGISGSPVRSSYVLLLLLLAVSKVEAPAQTGTAPGFVIFPMTSLLIT